MRKELSMRIHRLALATSALLALSSTAALAGTPPSAGDFHSRRFHRSATITNKWLPMKPGAKLVFTGTTVEGKRVVPHKIVTIVTDLTKVVGGVRSVVVWERDFTDGALAEAELSFYAQDDNGTVWHTGEHPEAYEHGKIVEAPTWLADVKGASAGIEMHAAPRLSDPAYRQGYAPPPINWTDHGRVFKVGQKMCVRAGCYANVVVIREYNPDEPGRSQLKYYAPGLGQIGVGFLGSEPGKETLELSAIDHLDASGLASARASALKLEKHAYAISKAVYGTTAPAQRSR
jgi:hypothetical protein